MNKHKPPMLSHRPLTEITGYGELSTRITRTAALRSIGEVVYAVRCGDSIKIGHTVNLAKRMNSLKATELLAFMAGTHEDEQALHSRLADHREHGREWYYPTPGVMAVVNEMRATLGLEPYAA